MARHQLTQGKVEKAKPKDKPYRLPDGENLYLFVNKSGVKSWQFRYRHNGQPQTLTIGKFPTIGLVDARRAAEDARRNIAEGKHLTTEKRVAKLQRATAAEHDFESVAAAWVTRESRRQGWSEDYRGEVENSIRNHLGRLFPFPVSSITAPMLAPMLDAVERTSPHMLPKVKQRLRAILNRAVMRGLIQGNPLPAPVRGENKAAPSRNFPAVTDLKGIGEILRAARSHDPAKGVRRAHLMLVSTCQRVGEVVGATWNEIDLDAGTWTIPRARMKMHRNAGRGDHVVPLPPTLLAMLKDWKSEDDGKSEYVCPARTGSDGHITREAVEKFYRRTLELSGKHSPHSWRSTFSTICRDAGKAHDVVEAQLDHVIGNEVQAAYDRSTRLELRRELMAWYEQILLDARDATGA